MLKLLVMSMMFSAVAACPHPCGDTQTENCLRPSGHLEITGVFVGVTAGASGLVIRAYAFSGCTSLTSVSMPIVNTINQGAFDGCNSLTSVTMPKVTTIGTSAFFACTSLTWVHMPKVTSIGADAFDGTPYSTKNPWQDKTVLKVQYSSLGC